MKEELDQNSSTEHINELPPKKALPSEVWGLVFSIIVVIICGYFLTKYLENLGKANERSHFQMRAVYTSSGISPQLVSNLSGTPADIGTAGYQEIRRTLQSVKQTDEQIRFAYLMQRRNNNVIFLVRVYSPLTMR